MDDYMEIAQRNHHTAEQHHDEFMHHAAEQHQHAQDVVTDEEMDKLEKEFKEWMTYIKNKKLY